MWLVWLRVCVRDPQLYALGTQLLHHKTHPSTSTPGFCAPGAFPQCPSPPQRVILFADHYSEGFQPRMVQFTSDSARLTRNNSFMST